MTKREARRAPGGTRRGGRASLAPAETVRTAVGNLDNLDEISHWLGTFRLRLSIAQQGDRTGLVTVIEDLEARYQQRRAELA